MIRTDCTAMEISALKHSIEPIIFHTLISTDKGPAVKARTQVGLKRTGMKR